MPNASRYLERGYAHHLTHRCHDRRFLLRTIRERNDYRKWLREGVRRYGVAVMDAMATFQRQCSDCINEHLQRRHLSREAAWTESLVQVLYRVECTCWPWLRRVSIRLTRHAVRRLLGGDFLPALLS